MIHLLSEEGRRALRALAPRPILYGFDFDGTLAPISANREAVKVSPALSEWLHELAKRACCAVVSGRALADLMPRIHGMVPHLIGNHGIESPLATKEILTRAEEVCTGWKRQMANESGKSLAASGAEIEDKRYSLTVHFRGAPDPAEASRQALLLLGQLTPEPHLITGKFSINVLPPGQQGKGPAALALMVHLRRSGLFFIGDDETDETVFALTEGLVMGVRVGRQAGSKARFYLDHPGEVEELIRFLVHRMDRTPEAGGPGIVHGTEAFESR
jgi:trehalose 6-phosphate phosphatase